MTNTGSFTATGGLRLYTRAWLPSNTPAAHVILIHGYGDHCGRYERFAHALNDASLAVHSYDQRGFGLSQGKRAYVGCFDDLLADLDRFLQVVEPDIHGKPVFMLGQSFGGLITVRYAETRQPGFSGLVLCSPFLGISETIPKPLLQLGKYIAKVAPWMPVSKVEAKGLSRRPEVVAAADQDPLGYHGTVRARTGAEMQKAVEDAFNDISRLSLPLYIVHGDADSIVPLSGSQRLYAQCASTDKTLRVFPGGYHELWQDLDEETMITGVCKWLRQRL